MMKVKANKTISDYITEGKVYEVIGENQWQYRINQDNGDCAFCHKEHLTVIQDTPQIEVGSEWVAADGTTAIVKYVSEYTVVFGEKDDCYDTKHFTEDYKPKPKTVTMYFHKIGENIYAYDVEQTCYRSFLFTREIEL